MLALYLILGGQKKVELDQHSIFNQEELVYFNIFYRQNSSGIRYFTNENDGVKTMSNGPSKDGYL